jgi:16S rRNA (guanine527-N7)-methyltransferase
VLDSLTAAAVLRDGGVDRFLDLGSGAGFPGLPLALALPDARAVLVDSIAKKTAFLSTVVEAVGLGARIEVVTGRAEDLVAGRQGGGYGAVVARAVASLPELIELALPLLATGGRLVAWKRAGSALDEELRRADRALRELGGRELEMRPVEVEGLASHRLILARKRGPTPVGYPRSPTERRRRPW